MNSIDTHCHLNFKAFSGDYLEVARRARDAGLVNILIVGSDAQTSRAALKVARAINANLGDKFARIAVGIHPIHHDRGGFDEIKKLAQDELVVAIGESGLDFFHQDKDVLGVQKDLFLAHIELANALSKPLIIHNREAGDEMREILDQIKVKKGVFHCFQQDHNFAKWATDKGFMISFTGIITYGNKKLKKVIERTDLLHIMIETDSPYLIPEPLRSEGVEINEPAYVVEVAKKIALVKNIDFETVLAQTTQNAKEFFSL